jgi:hypothetical protein
MDIITMQNSVRPVDQAQMRQLLRRYSSEILISSVPGGSRRELVKAMYLHSINDPKLGASMLVKYDNGKEEVRTMNDLQCIISH